MLILVEKKYAIVIFVNQSEVEVVPSSWLENNSTVKWPNNCTVTTITRYIRECKSPDKNWNTISVRVLGFAKTFSRANQKANLAQDTSNIGTDSSQSEIEATSRKRMKSQQLDLSTDEENEILRRGNKKKRFCPPNPPTLKEVYSLTANTVDKSQETLTEINSSASAETMNNSQETPSVPLTSAHKVPLPSPPERNTMIACARYLHGVSYGKTMSSFLLSITKKILSKSVAIQYSRLGRKGKKRFELVDEVYNAILTAAALKFKESEREELAEKFGRVLASACDWEGSRIGKKNSECVENPDNSF